MAANKHKVPKRQWRKWNDVGRTVFNETFALKSAKTLDILAPGFLPPLSKRGWSVAMWNVAWLAADAATEASRAQR